MNKTLWWIKGHLMWQKGWKWNRHLQVKLHTYCHVCPANKWISAYDFWKNYSPING